MSREIPYIVSSNAVERLVRYCQEKSLNRFFLIADQNTYPIIGRRAEQALDQAGLDVKSIILSGDDIIADERYLIQVFLQTEGEDRQYIAAGSGTVTDITRFVSHRSRAGFISLPTAPSVDGYTSIVAPLVIDRYKATIMSQAPMAVFADLPTLCQAPQAMIAAGLGDLLGKYTSLADWKLGALLYDEPYDHNIDSMIQKATDASVEAIDQIAQASENGVRRLMDGLIESGFGMLAFGDSRPASGSEHHIAHFLEMKLLAENRRSILHGAKVGLATIYAAQRYEALRAMSKEQARQNFRALDPEAMRREIRAGYGTVADLIIDVQRPFLTMTQEEYQDMQGRILKEWDSIQAIARTVPTALQIRQWVARVGGPVEPAELGLSQEEVKLALASAHYLRDRFTLNKLGYFLNL